MKKIEYTKLFILSLICLVVLTATNLAQENVPLSPWVIETDSLKSESLVDSFTQKNNFSFAQTPQTENLLNSAQIVGGSSLITQSQANQIAGYLNEGNVRLTKIFSKTAGDGKTAPNFHAAADGQGRTITVYRVQFNGQQYLIGGYNPQSWSSISNYNITNNNADRTGFIFNLTSDFVQRQKLNNSLCDNYYDCGIYQTYNYSVYGPTFGGGHDIWVDNSLQQGYAYNFSYGTTHRSNNILNLGIVNTGYPNLQILAFETFTVSSAPGEFYVADYGAGRIAVYNESFVFQRYLDTGFTNVAGLDFLPNGDLMAAGRSPSRIKIYNQSGGVVSDFTNGNIGFPIDAKTSPTNLIYVGSQNGNVPEFTTTGTFNRGFTTMGNDGIAVLPGNILWTGGDGYGNKIDVFDLTTGAKTSTIILDNGQSNAEAMYYSPQTNTVLIADSGTGIIFERTTIGAFVRKFTGAFVRYGVTRGPNGEVFGTDYSNRTVSRWSANGTFLGTYNIAANVANPLNIVWTGNALGVSNTAPNAVGDSYSTDEDTPLSVPANGVLGNDTDTENNALTAALVSGPANASSFTLNPDGSFDYMPNPDFNGMDSFTYKANDGQADSSTVTVTITVNAVNDAPSLSGVSATLTIDELVNNGFIASADDIDVPTQTLTFSLVGAPSGASIDASTGQFLWTPDETQGPGTYPFTVRVSDGEANTDFNITITVNEVNVAPTLSNVPATATIDELAAYSFTAGTSDADIPAQTLTFSLVGAPAGASIDPSTGQFSWTPSEAQGNGSAYSFTVRVSDGVVNTDAPINLTVNEVNSAPVLNAIADQTVDEETLLSVSTGATDSDDPANALTYSLDAGYPTGMTIDPNTGAISWTPTEEQGAGDYPVTVRVTDDGTGNLSDTKTFNVHVNEVNVAPVLNAIGNSTIDEQVAFGFTASATDADLPANNLTFSLVGAPSGASITSDGVFSWTPAEAQGPESYTFMVKVTDDGSPNLSDEETITITVNEVNLPPVLGAINNQTGYWGNAFGFTATASDPDIPANTLTFSLISAPAGASIHPASGAFAWTPTSGQIGSHTFTVRVTDNGTPNLYDEQSVTINVGRRPTTLVYTGDANEQYSDQQALSAVLKDNGGGGMDGSALSGKLVGFAIGTQNASASTDGSGTASADLILTQDPAPNYTVDSNFAGDALYLASSDSGAFDILQEDARAYYTGALFVNTSCATCSSGTATLSATVKDITAETSDSDYDAFTGDIRNATVTFVNRDTNTPISGCSNLSVGLVNLSDTKVGTATCNWNVNIGSVDSLDYTIGIIVNNYYTRNSSAENSILTVSKPIGTNFITGGGYLVNAFSNGQYAGLTGVKTNFGFNVKYNNSGKSLQGRVNVIVRGNDGRIYQIKGNVMRTLSVRTVTNNPLVKAAVYTGKANMTDITDPLNPVALGGNNTFQMELTDKGEPGSTDTLGITVWNDAGGLLFSSRWDGTRTIEQLLGGGNLAVR